ncbi:LPXTG cell wall anchor domain-containing protein [Streptomyces sp. B1I3]|uniref:LPXTG cell wall anchor domain-containing protein n=1 Tax=Streptomyces sp. B1I3 TaxID=3042264 RepID=UPI0027887DA7|nr:LPXTG cell wall anchor domain-containing protein [Streptomyces sp. B1I3]MDQ0796206.1 LPXTG-motif cell wall-anchored protein [Streptomyces sp. B1I3]
MPPKPPARLRDGRALTRLGIAAGLAVPTGLLGTPAAIAIPVTAPVVTPYDAVTAQQPACGDPDGEDFPIDTRIHGGPDTYASGGGYGTWYLDLINTTSEPCHSIHPVLVLTDEDRTLTPEQIQLEFTERAHPGEEHRVNWESTDRDEQIGVFGSGEEGDDFPGYTVPAERTVTVEIRMAFTSDTRPGKVTANAAIVQRRATKDDRKAGGQADGDWVGESEGYAFTIVEGELDGGTDADPDEEAVRRDAAGDPLPELARTGRVQPLWAGLTAGALILAGAALVLRFRRRA